MLVPSSDDSRILSLESAKDSYCVDGAEEKDRDQDSLEDEPKLKGGCCFCGICCAICEGETCFLSFTINFLILGLLCGIAAMAVQSWYWTGIVEHDSQASVGGNTFDYKFYSLVSYGLTQFCHYPQSVPDLDNNIDISVPSLSDWNCENWDNLDATISQGDTTYTLSQCSSSDDCKKCRAAMEEGVSWAMLGLVGLVPVGVLILFSKCCHGNVPEKWEKVLTMIAIFCLIGSIVCYTTGLRYASAECHDYNQELALTQSSIWNATTNGADNSDSSMEIGASGYLGIGTIACGIGALLFYALFFFFSTGSSWLLFLVLFQGSISVGFAIASLSFHSWYWSSIEKHQGTASLLGEDRSYTFYTLISYGVSKFCWYPRFIPQLSSFQNIGVPGYDDLRCENWANLNAQINIDGTDYTLLACTGEAASNQVANISSVATSACHKCQLAMLDAEGLASVAIVLTAPVVAFTIALVLGDAICPSACYGERAHKFLTYSSIAAICASIIFYLSALATVADQCDELNSELKTTTADLWSLATNGDDSEGAEMGLGPSAISAILALLFGTLALLTFMYFACCTDVAQSYRVEDLNPPSVANDKKK
mmetsp:Transcript_11223/g.18341  ORF Transcript_11223/g.18341 Transcript_11223/m.18341 type:complete len:596 (-) Transcript_11223:218-2005(-)